jgi:hypothetical protein
MMHEPWLRRFFMSIKSSKPIDRVCTHISKRMASRGKRGAPSTNNRQRNQTHSSNRLEYLAVAIHANCRICPIATNTIVIYKFHRQWLANSEGRAGPLMLWLPEDAFVQPPCLLSGTTTHAIFVGVWISWTQGMNSVCLITPLFARPLSRNYVVITLACIEPRFAATSRPPLR